MELALIIYFIDVLSSKGGIAVVGWIIGLVYLIISVAIVIVGGLCPDDKSLKGLSDKLPTKTVVTLSVLMVCYGWLMPSKDTAYKMLAAYGVTEIAQSEEAKRLAGKSLEVLERAMDEYLAESGQ